MNEQYGDVFTMISRFGLALKDQHKKEGGVSRSPEELCNNPFSA
jgi:hypothetical protein